MSVPIDDRTIIRRERRLAMLTMTLFDDPTLSLAAIGVGAWLLAHDFDEVDESAIRARFGLDEGTLAAALGELKRIGILADEADPPTEHPVAPPPPIVWPDRFSDVYVFACSEMVKVGISDDAETRRTLLQTGNPLEVSLVGSVRLLRAKAIIVEARVHQCLTAQGMHVRGEWFSARPQYALETVRRFADEASISA